MSIDLVVEQTLTRNLKSVGGLTRGKGFDDIQKNIFIFSRPICEVNEAVEKLNNAVYITSLTNDETGKVRIARDCRLQ